MFEEILVDFGDYLKHVNPDYVTLSIQRYNDYLIQTVKQQSRKLIICTINTDSEMELMSQAKPYAIVTDFPDRFIKK